MGRPERPLDSDGGPVTSLAHELRGLRQRAGGITYREMARRSGFSAVTFSRAAAGTQLPTLAVVLAYAEVCGADPREWKRRWWATAEQLSRAQQSDCSRHQVTVRGAVTGAQPQPDRAQPMAVLADMGKWRAMRALDGDSRRRTMTAAGGPTAVRGLSRPPSADSATGR
ncbi:helix-turn-helix transcriptional regulator [Streptomyces sp. NPDC001137]|uniref:helix-turn-helix domain-containing protein n=1 Tax=Streptomyces sp. NPDC001137 TaxID=3154378 RepID=UPI00332B491B